VSDTEVTRYAEAARGQLKGGFLALLAILVVLVVVAPMVDRWPVGRIAVAIAFYVAMLVAIRVSVRRKAIFQIALAAAIASVTITAVAEIFDVDEWTIPSTILSLMLLVITPVTVMARVVREERVTLNTVYGAVCVYLLLSLLYAFIFFLIEEIDPGSFTLGSDQTTAVSSFLYFSLVTQTTLGYGDITPKSEFAQSLASLQALMGQIFLVGTVARLVALQVAHSGRSNQE
jgi:predicted neutral ceramidase superfamily lipid hydrolase